MGGVGALEWQPSSHCRNTPHRFDKLVADITFDSGHTLRIEQRPGGTHRPYQGAHSPTISGQIHIRPSGEACKLGSVEVEILSNDERLVPETSILVGEDGDQVVRIMTPDGLDWWEDGLAPCVQVRVMVYVPQGGYLDGLAVDVSHLEVELARHLDMAVGGDDGLTIRTVGGKVLACPARDGDVGHEESVRDGIRSRRMLVQTVSGDIRGRFPLAHLLKMESTSGNISVDVAPQSADGDQSAETAVLAVHSVSGDIRVREPGISASDGPRPGRRGLMLPPLRDYVVEMGSASGHIDAEVVVSSRADFQSVSGNLSLELVLLCLQHRGTLLKTAAQSGSTTVRVLDPRAMDFTYASGDATATDREARTSSLGDNLSGLQSTHESVSGDIKLRYPGSWTGKFKAETLSGTITAGGKDVKITRSSRWFPKLVEGEKGEGNSSAGMGCMSGDVVFWVGD
ncbi:hypothetical protein E4U55_002017 [Claviceps digitariae]|nr:hypothetical protein E4U55_002017 [Claviceps digitariae]